MAARRRASPTRLRGLTQRAVLTGRWPWRWTCRGTWGHLSHALPVRDAAKLATDTVCALRRRGCASGPPATGLWQPGRLWRWLARQLLNSWATAPEVVHLCRTGLHRRESNIALSGGSGRRGWRGTRAQTASWPQSPVGVASTCFLLTPCLRWPGGRRQVGEAGGHVSFLPDAACPDDGRELCSHHGR